MVFSSVLFIFIFLPITLLGYYLMKNNYRNYLLLFASLIFFAWSQPNYLWVIILNITINYCGAFLIDRFTKARKPLLAITVLTNLGILFYFKYFDFLIQSLNNIFSSNFSILNIVLPIGISFFTFQGLSYVVDVYRKDVPVQKNPFKVALYIVLFPQLIAGPIVRYKDVALEIDNRKSTLADFSFGIERFIIGLAKKSIISNTMALTADAIWSNGATGNTWIVAWAGSIAYTLQIYFDFSGYSDMAIGLGRMFGFHFNENFNLPYISKNITEFWRRWHISLSSWFRDYVYIPLGGNRKHVYLNLSIVFLLTGIWHGASWHFIAWGIYNGFFILMERIILKRKSKQESSKKEFLPKIIFSKIYTLLVVNLGWVLFRAPHTRDAVQYIGTMFGVVVPKQTYVTVFYYLDNWTLFIMIVGIIFASSIPTKLGNILKKHIPENVFTVGKYLLLLFIFAISIIRIVSGTYNPFIYFQF